MSDKERDELARIVFTSKNAHLRDAETVWKQANLHGNSPAAYRIADGLIASEYRKPRIINTAEELDALDVGSVVVESSGDLCQRFGSGWAGIIRELDGELWLMQGAEDIDLPATVLHEPTP